jgi:hypothetical protein
MSMAEVKGTYEACVCECGRIMDKWVVRRWDAHRTDYCRTGALSGATQRHSYEQVPRFAGCFVVESFALLHSCTSRGVRYSETLEKTLEYRRRSKLLSLSFDMLQVDSQHSWNTRTYYLSVQKQHVWIQSRLGRECSRKTFCLGTLKRWCTFTRPRQRIAVESTVVCMFSWRYNPLRLYFHSPVAGFSLLVFEVSWSQTTTRHSR